MGKWEIHKLSDVVDQTITGEWGTECDESVEGVKVLRTTNFTNSGVINYDNVVQRNVSAKKIETKKLIPEDIILEKSGGSDNQPVGRVVFFNKKTDDIYLCNNFTQVLRVNKDIAIPRYVFLFLHYAHRSGITELLQNKTTGIRNLQLKQYMAQNLPLPPKPIQQKIADALDKASALIEMRKAQLEKLDLLIKSQFIEMFGEKNIDKAGWETSTLEELCIDRNDIKCGPFGTQLSKSEYRKNGIPLWGIPQINSSFKLYPSDYLDSSKAEKLDAYSILPEDIVMSRKGNVGQCSLYPKKFEKGIMHSDVLRIRLNSKLVNPTYIMYQMRFSSFVEKQISRISNGAIMAGLNVQKLKKIALHVPNLSIQNHFACIVHNVDKQKELLHYSLEELKANYRSLMQKCFRGEMF